MRLVDWAACWKLVPDDRPALVWLPPQRTPAPAATGGRMAVATAATREPRSTTLTLTPQQAAEIPLWLPYVLAKQDLQPGDRVTVDLADLHSVHLTGLGLLMCSLWRRVGASGEVLLTGGTRGLRAQLDALDLTPASCRAMVFGSPPAADSAPGPVPGPVDTATGARRQAPVVPQQRRSQQRLHEPDPRHARLALSGDIDLLADLRMQA